MLFNVKNLNVTNKGKEVVLGASLSLSEGEIHIIMGPNGSGKSSLLNELMGHPRYEVTGGKIELLGEDITTLATEKRAKKGLFLSLQHIPEIAGVSLGSFLFKVHRELTGEDVSVLDFHARLKKTAEDIGIDTGLISRSVNSGLSGGEKKQSEILQLAMLRPKVALLDEIDSGVDVDSQAKIFKAIETLAKGGTAFILVTHYPAILSRIHPTNVSIMKQGEITKTGGRELIAEIEKNGFDGLKT